MTKTRERKRPVVKPTPEKKPETRKVASKAAKPKESPFKTKPPSKAMHPAAIKRRNVRLKAKAATKAEVAIPQARQMDVPLVPRDLPKDTYTVVYAGSVMFLDSKKARHKLQRGETIRLTPAEYRACGSVLGRALVKGDLSMDQVHKLLKDSKGQVPGAVAFGQAPLEAIDFASALPVKDQESQATSVSLSLPNFVPMTTEDIMSWASTSPAREWLGDKTLKDLEKKRDLVAAIKARATEVEAAGKPDKSIAAPEGKFEDV